MKGRNFEWKFQTFIKLNYSLLEKEIFDLVGEEKFYLVLNLSKHNVILNKIGRRNKSEISIYTIFFIPCIHATWLIHIDTLDSLCESWVYFDKDKTGMKSVKKKGG